ncbi:MAG: DUF192 domain-containing protein [bacterium]
MNKKLLISFLLCVLILSVNTNVNANYLKIVKVKINDVKVSLEVADNDKDRETGLMNRKTLSEHQGMLFLFDKTQEVYFWMKNVNFPLDMLFVRKNKIVNFYSKVPTCKATTCPIYPSSEQVDSVIELKSGFCEKYKIKIGQKIYFIK